jgi:phosphoserine phosphatase
MITKEENQSLLERKIGELHLKGDTVVAFDFDELVVPTHLTKAVLKDVSYPVDNEVMEIFEPYSFERVQYLMSCMIGVSMEEYVAARDRLVAETPWRPDFDTLIETLMVDYNVIFLSAGLKDIIVKKTEGIEFDQNNILADEFFDKAGKIAEPTFVVHAEAKAFVIEKLKEYYSVVAIGHGMGDAPMLKAANLGITLNATLPGVDTQVAESADDILKIVQTFAASK